MLTIQPLDWLGGQLAGMYQYDNNFLGNPGLKADLVLRRRTRGPRVRQARQVARRGGVRPRRPGARSAPEYLAKFTGAIALTSDRGFLSRPELRLFYTWAVWNEAAAMATVDSGRLYTDTYPNLWSGSIFGVAGRNLVLAPPPWVDARRGRSRSSMVGRRSGARSLAINIQAGRPAPNDRRPVEIKRGAQTRADASVDESATVTRDDSCVVA